MIGYKNTISGGSSIMQPIRLPENTRNIILVMNLINLERTLHYMDVDLMMMRHINDDNEINLIKMPAFAV